MVYYNLIGRYLGCFCLPNVVIRPVALADSGDIFQGIREGELYDAVPGSEYLSSVEDSKAMVESLMGKRAAGIELHFSIFLENGKVVGMCALHEFDHVQHSAKIGYWISRPYRKKGYGKKAVGLLINVAFGELGITKLYAMADQNNIASMRLLRSLKFAGAGTSKEGELLFCLLKAP